MAAALMFAVFMANVVAGKLSLLFGAPTPFHIGNVPEFLLLLGSVVCFVVAILEQERMRR